MQVPRIVVGIVGESGSGKDTVAAYLANVYHVVPLRFSEPIKDVLLMFFDHPSREDQAWIAVEFKKHFGKDVFCRALKKKLPSEEHVSFNGLRYLVDYEFLRSIENNFLIYVTASQKVRWQRIFDRGEKSDDNLSLKQFIEMEANLETERDIPLIGSKADFTITNEGTVEELLAGTDEVMKKMLKQESSQE